MRGRDTGGGAIELGFLRRKKRGIAQNLKISVSGLPGWAYTGGIDRDTGKTDVE